MEAGRLLYVTCRWVVKAVGFSTVLNACRVDSFMAGAGGLAAGGGSSRVTWMGEGVKGLYCESYERVEHKPKT